MLLSCGSFSSFRLLYFLDSEWTVGINGTHQPSPELSALLTLAPMHVLVTQVQKKDSLFTRILLPFQCCLWKVRGPAPCHHRHSLAVCPLQCMLFICTAINKIQWIQRCRWYAASKTRKKAPVAVLKGISLDFEASHLHRLLSEMIA